MCCWNLQDCQGCSGNIACNALIREVRYLVVSTATPIFEMSEDLNEYQSSIDRMFDSFANQLKKERWFSIESQNASGVLWNLQGFQSCCGFWSNKQEVRNCLDWVGSRLGVKKPADWYFVKTSDIADTLGLEAQNSFYEAFQEVYPEYNWQFWRFNRVQSGTWEKPHNVARFLEWVYDALQLSSMQDWYHVQETQIAAFGGSGLMHQGKSLPQILKSCFPDYPWDPKKFLTPSNLSRVQLLLYYKLKRMFPATPISMNYKHPDLAFQKSGNRMELDIYFPALALAFEYQGKRHP